jgi:hypothetical protein
MMGWVGVGVYNYFFFCFLYDILILMTRVAILVV